MVSTEDNKKHERFVKRTDKLDPIELFEIGSLSDRGNRESSIADHGFGSLKRNYSSMYAITYLFDHFSINNERSNHSICNKPRMYKESLIGLSKL